MDRSLSRPSLGARITLLGASTLTVMAGATIAPSLPAIARVFHEAPRADARVPLVLTMPALAIMLTATGAGYVLDRFGRKRLLIASLALYAIAGAAGLWITSIDSLLLSRALLGLGVAGIMSSATTLVADYFTGPGRQAFMGAQGAAMAGGGIVFPLLGGALAEHHWRGPFAVYLAALLLLPGAWLCIHEPAHAQSLHRRATDADHEPVPWSLVVLICAAATVGMTVFYLIPVHLPFRLATLFGDAPSRTGAAIAVLSACGATASLQYRRVRRYMNCASVCAVLFTAIGAGLIVLAHATHVATVMFAMVLCGFGISPLMPNLNVWLTDRTPARVRGRVIGVLTACVYLGQFVSPLAARPITVRHGLAGVRGAFGLAGIAALVVAAAFALSRASAARRHAQTAAAAPSSRPIESSSAAPESSAIDDA